MAGDKPKSITSMHTMYLCLCKLIKYIINNGWHNGNFGHHVYTCCKYGIRKYRYYFL